MAFVCMLPRNVTFDRIFLHVMTTKSSYKYNKPSNISCSLLNKPLVLVGREMWGNFVHFSNYLIREIKISRLMSNEIFLIF